jgi:diadenosine tetraphosphate (Ap4A) HIT family hydrolase
LVNLTERRVELARRGLDPFVICRMTSGWLVIGDVQPLDGHCLPLADPAVESLNALDEAQRVQYSLDAIRAGDAVLALTDACRINYETLGNSEPAPNAHVIPRYRFEPDARRVRPAWIGYDWPASRKFDSTRDGSFAARMRWHLA